MPAKPKATAFRYVTAEGRVETRTSHRMYTHVVVGRRNRTKARACETSAAMARQHASNYDWFMKCVTTPIGKPFDPAKAWHPNTSELHAQATAVVAMYPTKEAYVAGKTAGALERIGPGDAGPECVVQWSRSERAASSSVSGHRGWHVDVRVVALPGIDCVSPGASHHVPVAATPDAAALA